MSSAGRRGSTPTAPLTDAPDATGADAGPPTGATIGRFVVIGLLGRGGMGVVLSAYDPVLDRRVALKLLRPGAFPGVTETEGRARLQREAQAMAKLSHPNVVAVHDVGSVDEQLFIAMEFVDGHTLKEWQSSGARDWREVVRMYVAAGTGLQAAHAVGLVHRDFKPDNVLIGVDGRPRVGDFGLVSVPRPTAGASIVELGATRHGAVLGTPGYMSPEQIRGEASGAQSDQFSFCVALYEALYGQRPFASDDKQQQVLAGIVQSPPRRSEAPRWLFDVILRGLRVRPEERWPSMSALLEALGRDSARRRRHLALAAAAVVLTSAVVVGVHLAEKERSAVCTGAAARLKDVWDDERRQGIERAFAATKLSFAEATFAKVAASLDRYRSAWVAMNEEACRATRVDGRQSDSLLDLRMACLDRRRATLGALTAEWSAGVDAQALDNAVQATAALPSLDECADTRALTERMTPPKDAALVARIDAVRADLDRARALGDSKRMQEARKQAELARNQADATGFAPVQAEAALLLGSLIHRFGEPGAVEPLQAAVRLAEVARDDRLAAQAAVELTGALAEGGLAPSAVELAPVAAALVVRAGDPAQLRGTLLSWRGTALINVGKYVEALAALTEARSLLTRTLGAHHPLTIEAGFELMRALAKHGDLTSSNALGDELLAATTEALGPDHPETGVVIGRLGYYAAKSGDYATGRRMIERSIAIAESAFGPESLAMALAVNSLGVLEEEQGHLEPAQRAYQRVLAIRRRLLAPDNPLVAHALANLSIITRMQGHLDEALTQTTTALSIMERNFGPLHSDVAYEHELVGDVLADKGDLAGAREHYQRAVDTYTQLVGPNRGDALFATIGLATLLGRLGQCDEARRLLIPTVAGLEAIGSEIGVAEAQVPLARCDLERGDAADALPRLQRAVGFYERRGTAVAARGPARFELARALLATGAGTTRAISVARRAEEELMQSGPVGARDLERVRAWLRRFGVTTR